MHLSPFVSVRIHTRIYVHTMPNCVSRANAVRTTPSIGRSFAFYFTHYAVYDGLLILIVFLIHFFFLVTKKKRFLDILGCRIKKKQKRLELEFVSFNNIDNYNNSE